MPQQMVNLMSGSKKSRAAKWTFVGGLAVLLLTGLTPLEFKYPLIALLTVAFVFAFSFSVFKNLAKPISIKWIRRTVANIPNAGLFLIIVTLIATFPFSIMSLWNSLEGYQTVWIKYRKKSSEKTHIALQMKDIGSFGYARRTVAIVPLTPFFVWVTDASDSIDSKEWKEVDEHYNPFGWKGP